MTTVFTAQGDLGPGLGPAAGDRRCRPDARRCVAAIDQLEQIRKGKSFAPAGQAAQAAEGSGSRLTVAGPAVLVSFPFPFLLHQFLRLFLFLFPPFFFSPFICSCACFFTFSFSLLFFFFGMDP